MGTPLRVLIVEDSEDDAALLLHELRKGGYEPSFERVHSAVGMKMALDREPWDLVLADFSMPQFSGMGALELLKEAGIDLPFILVSGTVGEDTAVAAMKAGAHDYIMKANLKRLVPAIERELREAAVRKERRRADETILRLAFYDALTNLPNRTLLNDRLERALLTSQREGRSAALLILDLDGFKEINDTMGHHSGDLLLQQIGPRLREALRESDTVARLGGDEFALLLPSADINGAVRVARKILEALERPFVVEGVSLGVGGSIGIALFPEHGTDSAALMRQADVAMYVAKEAASGLAVYAPEQDQYTRHRLVLMGELRDGIENNQLVLHYQPKVSLQTGHVIGVEALVRWQHPRQGLLLPSRFIALAERGGLIKALTGWVLDRVLQQCQEWHRVGATLPVAINLSARSLQDPQLADRVAELLEGYSLQPRWLELEITEGVIMSDATRALEILRRLDGMGVRLSIDDFGTGYSSLGYLKKLPVDTIKIDKSFVVDMAVNKDDALIVRSTIDLAHNLGLEVIAEGVENRETYDRLLSLRCDAAQGYFVSRPVPAEEIVRWLNHASWRVGRVKKIPV